MHYLYMAKCKDNSLYIGISNDPVQRVERHNRGQGSQWVRQHGDATLVYTEKFDTYIEAHRRELQVKKWSRSKKENLVRGLKP